MARKAWVLLSVAALVALGAGYWLTRESAVGSKGARVVGVVQLTRVDSATLAGFKEGMKELGYREGTDIVYLDYGPAGAIDHLEPIIRRQLAHKPDLFFTSSTPATQAVEKATAHIRTPVVFAPVNDPVGSGIVHSLKRPGGNLTGIRLPAGDDLRLGWLTKIVPGVKRVYLPYNPDDPSAQASVALARQAASQLGVELVLQEVRSAADVPQALASFPPGMDAIFLPRDSSIESRIADFVAFSLKHRLPVCAPSQTQTEAGALLSYGFVHRQIGHQAARLADQIFRGTAPADLPVETAESYLSINLRTAKAIGLAIPGEILSQADVIVRP